MKKLLFLIPLVFLIGCGSGSSDSSQISLPSKFTPNDGRLLASANCFQCHGTDGYSKTAWDSIAGDSSDEFNESESAIMQAQVKAFDSNEMDNMFDYLKNLKEDD